ncbi:MAG: hypothetical protein IJ022_00345 [Burkholderiaceae bacterium]|nr:hypothetical protein [Burkholderiaceae bacterium]
MISFFRHRRTLFVFVFLSVVAVAVFMRWQASTDEEIKYSETQRELFVRFNEEAEKKLQLTKEQRDSGLLFEAFKCRKPLAGDRKYCDRVMEKFDQMLTPQQRDQFIPLVKEYFSK